MASNLRRKLSAESTNSTTPFRAVDSNSMTTTTHLVINKESVVEPSTLDTKQMVVDDSAFANLGEIELNVVEGDGDGDGHELNGDDDERGSRSPGVFVQSDDDQSRRSVKSPITSGPPRMVHAETVETQTRDESMRSRESHSVSITQQTDVTDKAPKIQSNILEKTKLQHNADDVEIGVISDDENSPVITPYGSRMPSISYNNVDKDMAELRRASRRKWWSPTRMCDWCMHKVFLGKIMVMVLTWTTVADYGKDVFVAYHLGSIKEWPEFAATLCILFLSLRLMLYLKAGDDSAVSLIKLFVYYLPGSVLADFAMDKTSDVAVCALWEIAFFIGTPFVPFFLIYLAMRKSVSLFCGGHSFENPYLLSYAVVECVFETIPQLVLQSVLYFRYDRDGNHEIPLWVWLTAFGISILVLIKIPIVVWYNWRIVYKLSFKRRHNGEIMSLAYHPVQDLIATGSWDHTVLINSIIGGVGSSGGGGGGGGGHSNDPNAGHLRLEMKAKRVLDHHYHINCVAWMPKFQHSLHDATSDVVAVAGQGIELFEWRTGKSRAKFPKSKERDQLRRKKRQRTKEVKQCVFSPDAKRLIWCQGKYILVWSLDEERPTELLKIRAISGHRLGDIQSIDVSPNGKYIACGLYQDQIKVFNAYNKDLIRVLTGHTGPVLTVKFCRKGKYVISGGSDNTVRVWDLRYGEEVKRFEGHTKDVMAVAVDYSNRFIASCGRDRLLFITYLDDDEDETEEERHRHSQPHQHQQQQQQQQKGAQREVQKMRELEGWTPYKTARDLRCCDFSPYGDTVACASEDHQVHILALPKVCQMRSKRHSMRHIIQQEKLNDAESTPPPTTL